MTIAVVENWDQFNAFLVAQPLCKWSMQKQQEIATGVHRDRGGSSAHHPPKNDNADLAAALSSMA